MSQNKTVPARPEAEMLRAYLENQQRQFDSAGFPCVTEHFTREEVYLPAGDGVQLHTRIFRPALPGPYPTLVQRSCYPMQDVLQEQMGENFARRGYAYVVQACRGTGKSGGEWVPNVHERADGLALLGWLDAQSWVKSMGYFGASYLALTGWAVADAVPAKMKGMMLSVYGCDRFCSAYEKGLFRHDVLTGWAMQNAGFPVTADYLESCRYRPHARVDSELWGRRIPWYQDWIHAARRSDPYWQQGWWKQLEGIPARTSVPVYIVDAWYDHHFGSAIRTYEMLSAGERAHSWLDIGCWNHMSMNCMEWGSPQNLRNGDIPRILEWFDLLLMQEKTPEKRIRAYVMHEDRWQEYPEWPMPAARTVRFALRADAQPDGVFGLGAAGAQPQALQYRYDPQDPCPTHGAESVLTTIAEAGTLLQPAPHWRPDVLSFVSAPLTAPLPVCGRIRVCLRAATDGGDTAFTAKLMEVFPDGRACNIRGGITTIAADLPEGKTYVPGTPVEVTVDLWDIVWTLQPGSRLRLDVSSSDFPQYSVHSNYPGIWSEQGTTRVAQQTIWCGGENGSCVLLPCAQP